MVLSRLHIEWIVLIIHDLSGQSNEVTYFGC